jgi:cardiolipin synthase A/B
MSSKQPTDRTKGLKKLPVETERAVAGTARGINILPGAEDDGWVIPPPVKLADGSEIQLYKDGEAWHAAFEAMKLARFRICLELYIFASDETGQAVADLLSEKARAGLRVFVLYDSFGSLYSDRAMFDKMRHAGVHVQEFHPMRPWDCKYGWRAFNRDHRKLLLIDDNIAGLGGMNLGADYAGSWIVKSAMTGSHMKEPDLWRDNAIGIRGPATRILRQSFARTWHYVQHGGRIRAAELIHNIYHPGEFGVLASVPTIDSPLKPEIVHLLHNAKKSIHLTMAYFAPDDVLINELCKAADRGVKIGLMLPGRGDMRILVIAARSFYEKLMSHGIEIYERQNVMLHAKTIVVDGEISIIGSTNLDYRSIEYNCEISAVIRSETLGKQIEMLFENDVQYAKKIDPEVWQHRPHWDRFGQWLVSRARYLL